MLGGLRTLQANLRKSYAHTEQLKLKLDELRITAICIQEPHAYKPKNLNTYNITGVGREFRLIHSKTSRPPKAAIAIRTNIEKYLVDHDLTDENKAVVVLGDRLFVSMYFNIYEEDQSLKDIQKDLNELQKVVNKYRHMPMMILCDSNSRCTEWGDRVTLQRGALLHEFLIENELDWLNDPDQGPTYMMHAKEQNSDEITERTSYVDLSLINKLVDPNRFEWKKLDKLTASDHSGILISEKRAEVTESATSSSSTTTNRTGSNS